MLTVGVIVTAVQIGDRFVQQATSASPSRATGVGTILNVAAAPTTLLLALSVAHVLMLAVATVVSVYKPWGKTWFGRRRTVRPAARPSASPAPSLSR